MTDTTPITEALANGLYDVVAGLLPDLILAKNDAGFALAKGRMALRPPNNGVIKATEADRTVEMEGKTAELRRAYLNLSDLYDVCMAVISK